MKRKAPTTRGINSFCKPVGSTSSSNITGAENVIPSEEQPVADNKTNDIPVDMQTDDQQVVAPEEVAGEGKAATYSMVDRLLRLVITLPVSTATTERAFSAMKLVKTRLRNRMGDDFLRHYMIVYIGKKIAAKITSDEIINLFDTGGRRAQFKLIDM